MDLKYSIVEYTPKFEGYSCGYCKGTNSNFSTGMWAHTLLVKDYQELIDRGWRRSGQYCYKPRMEMTCCPQYTIRCEALKFKLTKSQKKILKRMTRFLKNGQMSVSEDGFPEEDKELEPPGELPMVDNIQGVNILETSTFKVDTSISGTSGQPESQHVSPESTSQSDPARVFEKTEVAQLVDLTASVKKSPRKGCGIDPSLPKCKKAKLARLEKKLEKMKRLPRSDEPPKGNPSKEKCLEELIDESNETGLTNQLELRLVRSSPQSVEFTETFDLSHSLYQKYQWKVHDSPPSRSTKEQFKRFLVHSPLRAENGNDGPSGYGSFHQQYWLNDKLIAVGVIDILPKCVSSVYFYYDPDYSALSLGTYSALREVALVRSLFKTSPQMEYYYMGFYIHSCPKMRYKAKMPPSYLLCPEMYTWHPVESAIPKLDKLKYSRLNKDTTSVDENSIIQLGDVLILWRNVAMTQEMYKHKSRANDDGQIIEYAQHVGRRCAESLLLYRP